MKQPEDGIRLNKILAQAGIASRRAADELILRGRVALNGVIVTEPGSRAIPGQDRVTVEGREIPLPSSAGNGEQLYLMLHKPVQVVSTAKDPEGRTTVLDLLPEAFKGKRLFPVGRLDYFSEGLLLLTNDGEMTLRLTHPRYHLPKTYYLRTREKPSLQALELMRKGMRLTEGENLAPVEVEELRGKTPALLLTLRQGLNRQIRRMCRDLNLTILTLRRISTGPLELGELPPGAARELSKEEITALKKTVGLL